jgi:ATP-dependent Clp protease ATP-binding subunit ClpX
VQVDTRNILFICGGAFTGIEDVIATRIGKKRIGFEADGAEDPGVSDTRRAGELLALVEVEDLLQFGLIPEFIGRLPVTCSLAPLGEDALVRIMEEPKNAVVRQYQKLFEMEGSKLAFTRDSLKAIARKAMAKETGARGIRSIVEDLMLDVMFNLPGKGNAASYTITEKVVEGEATVKGKPLDRPAAKSATKSGGKSGGKRKRRESA